MCLVCTARRSSGSAPPRTQNPKTKKKRDISKELYLLAASKLGLLAPPPQARLIHLPHCSRALLRHAPWLGLGLGFGFGLGLGLGLRLWLGLGFGFGLGFGLG